MRSDREWMYKRFSPGTNYINPEFVYGVKSFIQYVCQQPDYMDNDKIRCPCRKCHNRRYVELHLCKVGFREDYYEWVCHGEQKAELQSSQSDNNASTRDIDGSNMYRNMVIDAIGPSFDPHFGEQSSDHEEPSDARTKRLYDMLQEADQPLYPGCPKLSQLSTVARLLSFKSEHQISEKAYDAFLEVLKDALPDDNKLVGSFYETKKFACNLGLPCEKIHCCINGCMLYCGDDIGLTSCKFCHHSRYKNTQSGSKKRKTEIPCKMMHYFPLTPRLQRLYASEVTAKDMRWHYEHDVKDGIICHPSDAEAWKHFDRVHESFAREPRNVRLGLCTDGFQPFGQSGSNILVGRL